MDRYGTTRYLRNVIARWPGSTAARLLEWTPRTSLAIDDEITNEDGQPIEETFDVTVEEATAVLAVPATGFTTPEVGNLITITLSGVTTKSYVVLSVERPERAGEYLRLSVTLRSKQYVDYTVASND
jgi:hypothetical protein